MKLFMLYKILIYISLLCFTANAFASDGYPQTREERRSEELGSILEGDGFTFTPSKIKNESTKTSAGIINKYLWQASIETVNFAPLAIADSNGGVIITEWYTPKDKTQSKFKINIFIKYDVINPDSIEVKVFSQKLKNGQWVQDEKISNLASIIEDKILRLARELYIKKQQK